MSLLEDDEFDWPDAASWTPPPADVPPRPFRPQWQVSVLVPAGADPHAVWLAHVHEMLLVERCPRCMGPLLDVDPLFDDRPGWRRCRYNSYPDGWWKRDSLSSGGGVEWKLGMDPHTGRSVW